MKRKITHLLILATVFVSVGLLSSCKDYDEDNYNKMELQYQSLQQNYNELNKTIDALKKQLEAVNSCTCDKAKQEQINSFVQNFMNTNPNPSAASMKDMIIELIKANAPQPQGGLTEAQVVELINDAIKNIKSCNCTLTAEAVGNMITAAINDYAAQNPTLTQAQVQNMINSAVNGYVKQEELTNAINALNMSQYATIEWVNKALEGLDPEGKYVSNTVYQQAILDLNKAIGDVDAIAKQNGIDIKNLTERVTTLEGNMLTLESTANEALTKAKSNLTRIETLEGTATDAYNKAKEAYDEAKAAKDSVDELWEEFKKLALDDKFKNIHELIEALEGVEGRLDAKIKALQDQVDEILSRLDAIEKTLLNLVTGITIQGTYNPVFGNVSLPVGINSNVLVAYYGESTNKVVFPTASTANYVFPENALTEKDMEMLNCNTFKLGASQVILSDAEDNAGTLYVTINPNTVDFTGETLSIVNSQDEESGIKLGKLQKSDKVLMFGYTRAADNGFYEAKASLSKEEIENVKFNSDYTELESSMKETLDNPSFASIKTVMGKFYQQFQDILPAQGIKATYVDGNGTPHSVYSEYGVAATAIKPLSFAFAKDLNVKGMPYVSRIENYINRNVDKIINKLNINIKDKVKIPEMKVNKIEFVYDESQAYKYKINVQLTDKEVTANLSDLASKIGGMKLVNGNDSYIYVVDADGNYVKSDGTITSNKNEAMKINVGDLKVDEASLDLSSVVIKLTFDIDVDAKELIESVYGDINTQISDLNKFIADVKTFTDDMNKMLDDINSYEAKASDKIDEMRNDVIKVLDKINSKYAKIVNGTNGRIQPTMVGADSKNYKFLSSIKSVPTVIEGGKVTFFPTSRVAEVVAPAFKKHVACTNVFYEGKSAQEGDQKCEIALNNFNRQTDINEVIDGKTLKIEATLAPGMVYEIAYSALDYAGKIVTKKYYVRY